MEEHAIEETHVPHDCLDVVAQHIVSMVSVEDWNTDKLFELVRQSFCYYSLSKNCGILVQHLKSGDRLRIVGLGILEGEGQARAGGPQSRNR